MTPARRAALQWFNDNPVTHGDLPRQVIARMKADALIVYGSEKRGIDTYFGYSLTPKGRALLEESK